MSQLVILTLLACHISALVTAGGYYTIITPGTIHPNTLYNVLVSIHDAEETSKVKLNLFGPEFERQKEIEVPPKSTVNVQFEIPDIKAGKYELKVDSVSGIEFHNSTTLNFDDNKPSVFIQNDKDLHSGAEGGVFTLTNAHYPNEIKNSFPINGANVNCEDILFGLGAVPELAVLEPSPAIQPHPVTRTDFAGFGLSERPTKVDYFIPSFIKTNLPYSVKRGEVVTIPVLVFNYMDQPLEATVIFNNSYGNFRFNDKIMNQNHRDESVTVAPKNVKVVNFVIRPERIGQKTLKIKAVTHIGDDALYTKLKVEPEGITVFENRDFFVQITGDQPFTEKLVLDIPKEVVADSEHIEISLMGDILGSTVSNFDKLVRMPSGCGEQNMINFVPNILVLRYLESIKQLSPQIEEKAKGYLAFGYQRELTYKHDNGSYSAFGKSDKSGSTWLTAYVMRSFHQAAQYTDIDNKVLSEGLNFLANIQSPNGSFPEYGKVLDFSHHNEVGLTAFVLLAFLENVELLAKYKDVVENGFRFLEENINNTDDLYAISIAVYVLQLHKSNVVPEILAKLDVEARVDGGRKWWTKTAGDTRSDQSWRPKSHDVEITGYILMTLLDMNKPELPITKWLISQRNSNGGFASTQDTVVGLQALIKFAEKSGASNTDFTIEFEANGDNKPTHKSKLYVNKDNTLEVTTEMLPEWVREVSVTGKGSGTAVLQISYRYNIAVKDKKPSFDLKTKVVSSSSPQKLEMEICTKFTPEESEGAAKQSNMVVMEVSLPSGYTADAECFDKIKSVNSVKRVETKNSDTNVVIYFDGLDASQIKCVPVQAERVHDVSEQKPVPVVIYDYYDNQKRATEFYNI